MARLTAKHAITSHDNGLRQYLREFSRRRVGRATSTYAVAMWLSLQIVDLCAPLLALPEWTMSLAAILGLLGFPLVIALAWIFQITEHGIIVDDPGDSASTPQEPSRLALDASLLALTFSVTILTTVLLASYWN